MTGPKRLNGNEIIDVLGGSDWFDDTDDGYLVVRYYTIATIDVSKIAGLDPSPSTYIYLDEPFRIAVVRIDEQKYTHHIPWLISDADGNPVPTVERLDRMLPSSFYSIISTPLRGNQVDGYNATMARMDQFVGVMRARIGNNLFYQMVREALVAVATGDMQTLTDVLMLPTDCDGPFIKSSDWREAEDILKRIQELGESKRNRIQLALGFFERASQQRVRNKLFQYWVSIELICDTHSTGKIQTKLEKAYGSRGSYVRNQLGFSNLTKMRQDLFHRGLDHDVPRDVERYIQSSFLDLLRYTLRLPSQRHIARYIDSGFDVSRFKHDVGTANIVTVKGP